MKQLKFMLAAATAIGLATVVQADAFTGNGSTNFESEQEEALVAADGVFPAIDDNDDSDARAEFLKWEVPDDNFSTLVDSTGFGDKSSPEQYASGSHAKALNVDVGMGTLVRHIDNGGLKEGTVYIDTMVQFTVTSEGAPTPGEEDKLMLFAKKVDGDKVHLHVVAGKIVFDEDVPSTVTNVVDTRVEVEPNTWYRLTVMAYVDDIDDGGGTTKKSSLFKIWLDGTSVTTGIEALWFMDDDKVLFPSIKALSETAGVKAVGFSGEGKVDDLVFTTEYPFEASTVDFTLTMNGGSPVSVTIGGENYKFENNVVEIPAATTEFTVNYNSDYFASTLAWSNCSGCTANDATVTLNTGVTGASATLTLENNANATPPTVNDSTSAASVGINSGAFKDATGGELSKLLSWAIAKGVSKNVVNEIPPFEDETGNATNDVQAAYLLNCEVAEVATKKGEFKFTPNDFYKLMGSGLGATNLEIDKEDYNGEFVLEGATTLKDEISGKPDWSTAAEAPKFFRARLTK